MKHAAAVLLLALANKEINEKNINELLASVGVKPNADAVKALVTACKGKKCDQLVKEGLTKLGSFSIGGVAPSTAPTATDNKKDDKKDDKKGAAKKDDKKEKAKPKVEEEDDDIGFGGLF